MKTIAAAKFKEKCLSILENIDEEGLVITKHGKPLATLLPIRVQSEEMIGKMKGKIKIKGDILKTGVKWNVES